MGDITPQAITRTIGTLEEVLLEQQVIARKGAGVAAAEEVLAPFSV